MAGGDRWSMKPAGLAVAAACLLLLLAAPPAAAAPKAKNPQAGQSGAFRTALKADADDLEGLEKAVRECGLGPSVRRRDETGEWLDVGLPLERESAGRIRCVADWMHGKTGVDLGMFTEPLSPGVPIGRVPDHAPREPGDHAFAVIGPVAAVGRFETAARGCGFTRIDRKPADRGRAMLFARGVDWDAVPRDPKLQCVDGWMKRHPEEELDLVVDTPGG